MPLSALARRAAHMFKDRIEASQGPRIRSVRVFGSRARGDWNEGSDLDILVLVDHRDPSLDRTILEASCSVEEELGFTFLISPRIMAQEHFEELLQRELRLARDIIAEGVIV
ncbi:MAG: nucleotidyltransferase domain-containing protein [Armatimonadetes bacterium]|nr:nucleotidyltransferase domain-containing protein [Armatimonadota bacterium]